jgi:hypothetical protein
VLGAQAGRWVYGTPGRVSRRDGGLAAVIFVFWSRPTGIMVLVIAIVLLAGLGGSS